MHKALTNVDNLVAANAILAAELGSFAEVLVEDLFTAPKEKFPQKQLEITIQPLKMVPPKRLATFPQIITLAHAINRRYGRMATKGCNCYSCGKARLAA